MNDKITITFVLLEITCLIGLVIGVLFVVSPFYLEAGIVGWMDGYDNKRDVLLIGWLTSTLGSIFIGVIMIVASGFFAVTIGIGAGLTGMTVASTTKPPPMESEVESTPINVTDSESFESPQVPSQKS